MSDNVQRPAPRRRTGGRPFERGVSGNPKGRPPGARNKATLAAEMLLDGEAEALTGKAVERALAGSDLALKICLERILAPRRERTVRFALPAPGQPPAGRAFRGSRVPPTSPPRCAP